MRGRKPKPTALKILAGNPGKRPLNDSEPKYEVINSNVPQELIDGKFEYGIAEWNRIVPELSVTCVATKIDRTALLAYCIEYHKWLTAQLSIAEHGMFMRTSNGLVTVNPYIKISKMSLEAMMRFMSEFGMTPSARTRMKVALPNLDTDEFLDFLDSES